VRDHVGNANAFAAATCYGDGRGNLLGEQTRIYFLPSFLPKFFFYGNVRCTGQIVAVTR
jgi:hypothetical protein